MESEPAARMALVLEYDGTSFSGFQFQVGRRTIQGDIEQALLKVTGERIRVTGAGRTDAGVHAKGQVVSFSTFSTLSAGTMARALNYYLGPDIVIREARKARAGFNARRDAISRYYRYEMLNTQVRSPLLRKFFCHVPGVLDAARMDRACRYLIGAHDFAAFTGPTGRSTVREVFEAEVRREGDFVSFDIVANAFLPKQVRNIAGSLIRVGQNKMDVDEFREILESGKANSGGPAAPSLGLYLMKVSYPEGEFLEG